MLLPKGQSVPHLGTLVHHPVVLNLLLEVLDSLSFGLLKL